MSFNSFASKLFSSVLMLSSAYTAGCTLPTPARSPTMELHVDRMFTPDERSCIGDSVKQWSDQTSGLVEIQLEYDYNSSKPLEMAFAQTHNHIVRWTSKT